MKKQLFPLAAGCILLILTSCSGFSVESSNSTLTDLDNLTNTISENTDTNSSSSNATSESSKDEITSSNETTSESTTSETTSETISDTTNDTTSESTDDTTSSSDKYISLSSLSSAADDSNITVLATVIGYDGRGYFIQDSSGYFYVYTGPDVSYSIGKKYEIQGTISTYAGNKQINKGANFIEKGTGDVAIIKPISSLKEIEDNKYAPISFQCTLESKVTYTANNDLSIKVKIGTSSTTLFIYKGCADIATIADVVVPLNAGDSLTISCGFSTAYNNVAQIALTDSNSIIGKEPETDAEIVAYAKKQLVDVYALNNTTIISSINLPTSAKYGITFEYVSSNPTYLSNSGVVTRPEEGQENENATFTVKILINGTVKDTTTLSLIIKAKTATSGEIELDKDAKAYFSSIDFGESKEALKQDLGNLINKHTVIGYTSIQTKVYPDSDVDSKGFVYDIYSSYKYTISDYSGSYKNEGDCFNKEHTVPQSWFGQDSPYVSDVFHIYPSDGKVNGIRSNYLFGEVKTATYTSTNNSMLGSSALSSYNGTVFEVADEYKGDVARSYFYMCTAYQNVCGSWGHHFTTSNFTKLTSYSLELFTKWAEEDPVSQREKDRNNGIYKHQNNRNPYIDVPQLGQMIFGN